MSNFIQITPCLLQTENLIAFGQAIVIAKRETETP